MPLRTWLWAALVLTVAVAMTEWYDPKVAWTLALVTLLSILLTNRDGLQKFMALFGR